MSVAIIGEETKSADLLMQVNFCMLSYTSVTSFSDWKLSATKTKLWQRIWSGQALWSVGRPFSTVWIVGYDI